MDNGDIVVGKNPLIRSPKTVIVENQAKRPSAPTESAPSGNEQHSGAMSLQGCNSGAISTPQKFQHLVGCHEVRRSAKTRP